jgi:hypothetical protein
MSRTTAPPHRTSQRYLIDPQAALGKMNGRIQVGAAGPGSPRAWPSRSSPRTGGGGTAGTAGARRATASPSAPGRSSLLARVQVRPHARDHGCRCRVPQHVRLDDVGPIDADAQFSQAPLPPDHLQGRIAGQLSRHPGGDEDLARSDRAVVDFHSSHVDSMTAPLSWRRAFRSDPVAARCFGTIARTTLAGDPL